MLQSYITVNQGKRCSICNEELVVNSAAWGIFFYIKGIDPNITLTEKIKYIPIVNMLTECEKTQRMEQLKKLKNGIM